MNGRNVKSLVIYLSPAGTTRHVSQVIEKKLKELGCEVKLYDLGKKEDSGKLEEKVKAGLKNCCLWVGTPVYAGHAVPQITDFISGLPEGKESFAVPFVTWGAVTSGLALDEMGKMFADKGYAVLGAAKIVAVHSMMWRSKDPLGGGHPDVQDDKMMDELVSKVHAKLQKEPINSLPLANLNYQPPEAQEWLKTVNIEAAKKMLPPLQLVEEACTKCGICEKECPAFAITLDPYPIFGDACILCYNCVRLCEDDAIKSDLSQIETMLKGKVAEQPESPPSQVFV
jgi:ferredoxin/flavodoxin